MALRRRSGRDWFCRRSRAHSGSCWRGFCCPGRSAPLSSSGNVEIGTDSQRDLERFPHGRSRWERGPRWEAASGVYSCYGVGGGRVPEGITLGSEIANHNSRVNDAFQGYLPNNPMKERWFLIFFFIFTFFPAIYSIQTERTI